MIRKMKVKAKSSKASNRLHSKSHFNFVKIRKTISRSIHYQNDADRNVFYKKIITKVIETKNFKKMN